MKKSELALLNTLNQHVDNFDNYADAYTEPGGQGKVQPTLVPQKGNPNFSAQFSLISIQLYFTATAATPAVFTQGLFNAIPAALQTQSIFALFGFTDFVSGYAKVQGLLPLAGGWAYGRPFVFGKDAPVVIVNGVNQFIDATVSAQLRLGDVVIPMTAATAGPVYNVLLSVIRCQQVEYSSLLNSNVGNSFFQKGIRYILNDTSANGLLQYGNALYNFNKSWLGKFQYDSTDVNSNKQPTNFQNGVIDVPLTLGITKSAGLASYVNISGFGAVNNVTLNFSVFASNVQNPQT